MATPKCVIEMTAGSRWDAEAHIRAAQRRWGYDWREIAARLPSGEFVQWEPLAVTLRRSRGA